MTTGRRDWASTRDHKNGRRFVPPLRRHDWFPRKRPRATAHEAVERAWTEGHPGTPIPPDGMVGGSAAPSPRTIGEALPIFLRHASPRALLTALLAAAGVRIWWGEWSAWDLAPIAATVAVWPVQEWLIHVYVLHFTPLRLHRWTIDFRVPRKHREHHRDPWNYEILFIPLHSFSYSLPIALALWFAVTPSTALALTGLTVHAGLALHYEWIHFLVHTRVAPRSRYYQRIWRHHRLHHFKNEHYWYGVTRIEGDWLFRTAPAAQAVPLSPTARTLLRSDHE